MGGGNATGEVQKKTCEEKVATPRSTKIRGERQFDWGRIAEAKNEELYPYPLYLSCTEGNTYASIRDRFGLVRLGIGSRKDSSYFFRFVSVWSQIL